MVENGGWRKRIVNKILWPIMKIEKSNAISVPIIVSTDLRDNFHRRFLFKERRSFVSRTYYFRFLRWIALKRDREVEGKWEEKDRKSFHDIKITSHSVSYRANDKTFSLYMPSKPCLPISSSRVCAFTNSFDYINYEFPFFSSLSLFLWFFSSSIKFYRIVVQ